MKLFLFLHGLIYYLIFAAIFYLILEVAFKSRFEAARIQNEIPSKEQKLREFITACFASLVFGGVIVSLGYTPWWKYNLIYHDFDDYHWSWIPISFLLAFIIQDTYFYWVHRLIHDRKLFSWIHAVHHKSNNPTSWAAIALGGYEAFLEVLIYPIIFHVLPIHLYVLRVFAVISFLIFVYGHSGFEIAPKWFRKSIFFKFCTSSVHHNIHHKKYQYNYGLYFRWWDKLLKTEDPMYTKEYDEVQTRRFPKHHCDTA